MISSVLWLIWCPTTLIFCPPSSRAAPLHLQPGVVHRWWHGGGHSGRADVTNDAEGLPQGVVHPQHLVSVLRLLLRLLHQRVLVTARVQVRQQLGVNELLRLDTEGANVSDCEIFLFVLD